MNSDWDWHCGNPGGTFNNLRFLTKPLNARMGTPSSAKEYLLKGQVMGYEGHRAMFEAYNVNKYVSKGVIQWMLNNPWPEMIWHLYDYYFNQGGSYFATKKACENLHIQLNYNTKSVAIVNSLYTEFPAQLNASAFVYSVDGSVLYHKSVIVPSAVPADGVVTDVIVLPSSIPGIDPVYFVHLLLQNNDGVLSRNTYWLSTTADELDYSKSTFYNTPCTSYANFQALQKLPSVTLNINMKVAVNNRIIVATVSVQNPSNHIAFFIRLRIVKSSDGMDILPVFWSDNMFSLMPQESVQETATFDASQASSDDMKLIVELWNGN